MGVWVRDGFEFYGTGSDAGLFASGYGAYFSAGTFSLSQKTPYGVGQSLRTNSASSQFLVTADNAFANSATVFVGLWLANDGTLTPGGTTPTTKIAAFRDGASGQCSIWLDNGGNITLRSGLGLGTILATWSGAVFSNQWEFYCFKVVINNTTGSFEARKNWNTSNDFTATGLNTRGGTAANQVNGVECGQNGGGNYLFDDLAFWDNSGSGDWSDWMLPFRAIQACPISDASVQFTQTNGGSTTFGSSINSFTSARSANFIYCQPFTPTCGGSLGNFTVELSAGITGHLNIAIYDSDGDNSAFPISENQPGNLVATCTALTNPTSGANTFVPTTTPIIQNGRLYYIAVISDVAVTFKADGVNVTSWQISQSYGAFPSSLAGLGSTLTTYGATIHATITPSNAGMVNDYTKDLATYVGDSTVNDQDLYNVQDLPGSGISGIFGVDLLMLYDKDVAGTRTISALIKSGGTTVTETAVTPTTTVAGQKFKQDTDPNTGLAWTASGINAMQIGQKIAS